eukprot:6402193-Prymnesium_polylepis.1
MMRRRGRSIEDLKATRPRSDVRLIPGPPTPSNVNTVAAARRVRERGEADCVQPLRVPHRQALDVHRLARRQVTPWRTAAQRRGSATGWRRACTRAAPPEISGLGGEGAWGRDGSGEQ